ncbi:hypothetical protein RFI_02370 [Reticulomyxa filosa]|uniref:Isopenicillin N synthase-like Fe(2+) 2OG dioxygenase domain-containing protein n=1 Tax=Reticulomyxa filosa TaxID=46433 RepID=X6P9H9_RETFI|nr:hypothetical protein RFI_02370 [Reticulomyxa filosa]|eukprot:ETO34724.1 hypothetical protein RFI_02370 [Reticulomyxa filosa]
MSVALDIVDDLLSLFETGIDHVKQPALFPDYLSLKRVPVSSLYKDTDNAKEKISEMFAKYGFLILENDIPMKQRVVKSAEELSLRFFNDPAMNVADKMKRYHTDKELGYANTTAKEAFHIKVFDECTHKDIQHPFPGGEFESVLTEVYFFLESITKRVFEIVMSKYEEEKKKESRSAEKIDLNAFRAIGTPKDGRFSSSLLSVFCYRNTHTCLNDKDAAKVVNCNAHVDQGFLSIEPCPNVTGLEVFLFATKEWIRIDQFLQKHDLVLFCSETTERITQSYYRGVLHRVGANDAQRLSMVYKMRHKDITPDDMKLHFGPDEQHAFYQYNENGDLVKLSFE